MTKCCWPGCEAVALKTDLPVCNEHFVSVGSRFIDERTLGGSTYRSIVDRDHKARRQLLLERELERGRIATEARQQALDRSVVYYVRTGRYIKIGYTSDLASRMHSLRLDRTAVLATEPGARRLEAERHAQFAEDRIGRREDFVPSLALMEHIRELTEAQ